MKITSIMQTMGLVATSILATSAQAQELSWAMMAVRGGGTGINCDKSSVQMVENGTSLSLLFDNMNADLAGGDKKRKYFEGGTCMVDLKMTVPKGYYLASSNSSVFAGVEKSAGASGYIQSSTHLWGKYPGAKNGRNGKGLFDQIFFAQKVFKPKGIVSEPIFELTNSKTFNKHQVRTQCEATKKSDFDARMVVYLTVSASRSKDSQTSIVSVDSSDTNFELGLNLEKCAG